MSTTRLTRRTPLVAVVLALLLVAMMVTRTSQAAFTAQTDNSGNSFTAGTVVLADDDLGSALFNLATLSPGDSHTDCIEVTYSGTITDPQAVVLYSGGYTDSGTFATYLNLTVLEGDAGATCAAFASSNPAIVNSTLAAFDAASTDYASGVGSWTPTSTPETRAYQFTVELDSATPNSQQGESVTAASFTWEIQS